MSSNTDKFNAPVFDKGEGNTNDDFDIVAFNTRFEDYIDEYEKQRKKREEGYLAELEKKANKNMYKQPNSILQMSLGDIIYNLVNRFLGILVSFLTFEPISVTLSKNNNMFFLGIIIIILFLPIYLF